MRTVAPFLARVQSVDLVHEVLLLLRHLRELATITGADILAACAEPHGFGLEVRLLLVVQMAPVQIMEPPVIPVACLCASEITQPQT